MLLDTGIKASVITSDNTDDNDFIATCWSIQIIRGALICLLLILAGYLIKYLQNIGVFYDNTAFSNSELFSVIILISFQTLIEGFISINIFVYDKNLIIRPYIVMTFLVDSVLLLLNITLAIALKSFYALIFSSIISSIFRVCLSYFLFRGPRMYFKLSPFYIKQILKRGKWIALNSILTMIYSSADRILLGNYLPINEFGVYIIAKQLFEPILRLLKVPHSNYGLQIAKKSIEKTEKNTYFNYRIIFLFLGLCLCFLFLIFSQKIIEIVYDDRYINSHIYINILCLSALTLFFSMNRELLSYKGEFAPMAVSTLIDSIVSIFFGSIVLFYFDNYILSIYIFSMSSIFSAPYIYFSLSRYKLPINFLDFFLLVLLVLFLFGHYLIIKV